MEKHVLDKKGKSRRAKDNEKEEDLNNMIFKDEAAIVNLHNNRVGRKVNKKTQRSNILLKLLHIIR